MADTFFLEMECGRHFFSRVGKLPKKLYGLDCKFLRKTVKFELKLRLELKLKLEIKLRIGLSLG